MRKDKTTDRLKLKQISESDSSNDDIRMKSNKEKTISNDKKAIKSMKKRFSYMFSKHHHKMSVSLNSSRTFKEELEN